MSRSVCGAVTPPMWSYHACMHACMQECELGQRGVRRSHRPYGAWRAAAQRAPHHLHLHQRATGKPSTHAPCALRLHAPVCVCIRGWAWACQDLSLVAGKGREAGDSIHPFTHGGGMQQRGADAGVGGQHAGTRSSHAPLSCRLWARLIRRVYLVPASLGAHGGGGGGLTHAKLSEASTCKPTRHTGTSSLSCCLY